jgi:hypothetical protein
MNLWHVNGPLSFAAGCAEPASPGSSVLCARFSPVNIPVFSSGVIWTHLPIKHLSSPHHFIGDCPTIVDPAHPKELYPGAISRNEKDIEIDDILAAVRQRYSRLGG